MNPFSVEREDKKMKLQNYKILAFNFLILQLPKKNLPKNDWCVGDEFMENSIHLLESAYKTPARPSCDNW